MRFSSSEQNRADFGRQDAEFEKLKRERDDLAREWAAHAGATQREMTAILESLTDAFTALDRDWRYTYINKAADEFIRAAGRDPDDLLGKVVWEEFPEFAGTKFQTELFRATREGVVVEFDEYYPPLGAWFHLRVCPSERGVFVYFEDVTQRRRTEEALRESEERFRLMADAVPQIIWITDGEGRVQFFNKQWSDYTGVPYEPTTAAEVSVRFVHPNDATPTMEAFNKARRVGGVFEVEHRIRSAAGTYQWFLVRAEPYRDQQTGEIVRWFGSSTDIHDRKLAEDALRESEEKYRMLFNSMDEGFFLAEVIFDEDERPVNILYLDANPAATRLTGQDYTGRRLSEINPGFENYWFETFGRVARTGEGERAELYADPLKSWFSFYVFKPGVGDDVEDRRVAVVFQDVTKRRKAEKALRESEEQLRAIYDSTKQYIGLMSPDGTLLEANHASLEFIGATREDVIGRPFWETPWWSHTPKAPDRVRQAIKRAADGKTVSYEVELRSPSGQVATFDFSIHPVRNEGGDVILLVPEGRDITERKWAEEERERFLAREWQARAEAEERKRISRELHDRVAHSIGVVHQSLELYEAFKGRNPSQAEARIELARETTQEALEVTRNLTRELQHSMEASDGLSAALSNLLKTTVPPSLESSISIEGDESLLPPFIREQLFLIIREAVRNTVSHSGAKNLKVEVRVNSESVVGCVEDDGRGFEETPNGSASGRGLHSMRERAELVRGALKLSSTPGAGTKIEVSVPLSVGRGERGRRRTRL